MKRISVICLVLLLAILAAACGSGSSASAPNVSYNENGAMGGQAMDNAAPQMPAAAAATAAPAEMVTESIAESPQWYFTSGGSTGESTNAGQPEKIIKTGSVELSTQNFDSDKTRLESLTKEMGGFIESSNVYNTGANRRYEAVLRVPGERFADMKKAVEETGKLISSNESEQNVTNQYYDAQGRLESKKVEEARILDMISKADNVDTLLRLEEYLGRVRTDIDLLESQIKDIDSLSSYSTINVTMTEGQNVKLMANTGNFGQKLLSSFKSSASATGAFFGNVLVFLAGAVVPLALIALVAVTGIVVYKKARIFDRKERVIQ